LIEVFGVQIEIRAPRGRGTSIQLHKNQHGFASSGSQYRGLFLAHVGVRVDADDENPIREAHRPLHRGGSMATRVRDDRVSEPQRMADDAPLRRRRLYRWR